MKLADLGLKTKPATKYFEHGYVRFSTSNKELFYEIHLQNKHMGGLIANGKVKDQEHLKQLFNLKTIKEAANL